MNFDVIISNPPYNRGLDLKILQEIYSLGDKICMVHPATWLYDNKMKNKLFKKTRELVKDYFISYEKVQNANKLFGIGLFTDVFITFIDKNQTGLGNGIYDIDIHGDSVIYKSLKYKILGYTKENENLDQKAHYTWKDQKTKKDLEWEVGYSGIRGHPGTSDWYTFLQLKNEEVHWGNTTEYALKFYFHTETEAYNFKEYLKLKLTRFCFSIYKMNQNLDKGELLSVPYMPTYTKVWTDEDVAKELGLTDEELQWAINWIPDYYPEDSEKYK